MLYPLCAALFSAVGWVEFVLNAFAGCLRLPHGAKYQNFKIEIISKLIVKYPNFTTKNES